MATDPEDLARLTTVWEPLERLATEHGLEQTVKMSIRPDGERAASVPPTGLPELAVTVAEPPPSSSADASGSSDAAGGGAAAGELVLAERIGGGGMGDIYRAVQGSLGREVAVKVTRDDRGHDLDGLFVGEARVTGYLDHANIVPVHALGRGPAGRLHLAMKLVRGRSWDALIHEGGEDGRPLGLEEHLRIFLSVCNAVAFAHDRGIVHRDLKPENVMVGEFGEVFVMDWGLAAPLDAELAARLGSRPVAATAGPSGTPSYMAPELAAGDGASQDERTDVYLLGACLYEAATGKRRHRGRSLSEVLASAVRSEPLAPDGALGPELAEICNRAMARDPADRFAGVAELRAAIETFRARQQARAMIEKGRGLLERLRAGAATAPPAPDEPAAARAERELDLHGDHAKARFAFESALELWEDAAPAREGLREASRIMLEHAIAVEDVAAARRLARECDDAVLRERADALVRRAEARAAELTSLREQARRNDWSAVESALGTQFIIAGVLVAAGTALTDHGLRADQASWIPVIRAMWLVTLPVIALFGWLLFRKTRVPDSPLAVRLIGTWGTVALGCVINQSVVVAQGLPYRATAPGASLLLGVGFAAMAFQTRWWLLAPAATFLGMSYPMAHATERGLQLFAAAWLVVMTGTGIALRLGAGLSRR